MSLKSNRSLITYAASEKTWKPTVPELKHLSSECAKDVTKFDVPSCPVNLHPVVVNSSCPSLDSSSDESEHDALLLPVNKRKREDLSVAERPDVMSICSPRLTSVEGLNTLSPVQQFKSTSLAPVAFSPTQRHLQSCSSTGIQRRRYLRTVNTKDQQSSSSDEDRDEDDESLSEEVLSFSTSKLASPHPESLGSDSEMLIDESTDETFNGGKPQLPFLGFVMNKIIKCEESPSQRDIPFKQLLDLVRFMVHKHQIADLISLLTNLTAETLLFCFTGPSSYGSEVVCVAAGALLEANYNAMVFRLLLCPKLPCPPEVCHNLMAKLPCQSRFVTEIHALCKRLLEQHILLPSNSWDLILERLAVSQDLDRILDGLQAAVETCEAFTPQPELLRVIIQLVTEELKKANTEALRGKVTDILTKLTERVGKEDLDPLWRVLLHKKASVTTKWSSVMELQNVTKLVQLFLDTTEDLEHFADVLADQMESKVLYCFYQQVSIICPELPKGHGLALNRLAFQLIKKYQSMLDFSQGSAVILAASIACITDWVQWRDCDNSVLVFCLECCSRNRIFQEGLVFYKRCKEQSESSTLNEKVSLLIHVMKNFLCRLQDLSEEERKLLHPFAREAGIN